jgi:hypothetical protein
MTGQGDSTSNSSDHAAGVATGAQQSGSETNRLLEQVRDRDLARSLERRLFGHGLPDVELRSIHATRVPLLQHVSGQVVVEFFPGGRDLESELSPQALHRRLEGWGKLARVQARTISVISDALDGVDLAATLLDPRGLVFCDPELQIAATLRLPTIDACDAHRYQRLALITKDGRIGKVIFPPEQDFDRHIRQIVSWIQASRW